MHDYYQNFQITSQNMDCSNQLLQRKIIDIEKLQLGYSFWTIKYHIPKNRQWKSKKFEILWWQKEKDS